LKESTTIVDVRSPKEYLNGHIPTAVNIPLFSDEERHIVGKTYRDYGKEKAIEQGVFDEGDGK
jgi:tRNA 2-selenouridine synthase